jgi:hypothetical protein
MHGFPDPDELIYGELMEEALLLLAAGDMSGAFSQAWQACLIELLVSTSSGLMEEARKQAEPGLAAITDAVLAARREAISLLVPPHRLSFAATFLPQQSPTGDVAGWVDAWKEAIRLARERGAN